MAKYSKDDLICIHNNLAKRKRLATIEYGAKMSTHELCDKIEAVNNYVRPVYVPPIGRIQAARNKYNEIRDTMDHTINTIKFVKNKVSEFYGNHC